MAQIKTDVAIVGGGIIGAVTSVALAREGLTSVVCDPTPLTKAQAPDFDGRAYAVALASRRMFSTLGLWAALEPQAQEIKDILVSDGRVGEQASPLFLHFDHSELGMGAFGHMLEDRHLRGAALNAALDTPEVRYLDGVKMQKIQREKGAVFVELSNGDEIRAQLVVGCDGRRSQVARSAGLRKDGWEYGQVGLVCAVRHERPHNGVAHEFFLPSGPFAILPLKGDRSALVWTERAELAQAMGAVDDATYLAEVRRRFGGFLGELTLEGKRWAYPLNLSIARAFTSDRLALAGDAARGIHPIAGQGLNYGLRDSAALAEVLGEAARRGEDIGAQDVLARYERWRRPDSLAIAAATDGLNKLFSNDFGPLRLARRLGLAAFGAIGPARRAAMRFAAGARSDLPKMMMAESS